MLQPRTRLHLTDTQNVSRTITPEHLLCGCPGTTITGTELFILEDDPTRTNVYNAGNVHFFLPASKNLNFYTVDPGAKALMALRLVFHL